MTETPTQVKLKRPLEEGEELFDVYCMKCRVKIKNLRGRYRTTPNNRGLIEGQHSRCGTKVVKITKLRQSPKKKVKA